MGCARFDKYLELYLSGELKDSTREQVEKHLGKCRSCREEMDRLEALTMLLGRASGWRAEPPPNLAGRIMAGLPSGSRPAIRNWKILHPVVAVLSLAIALGLGYMIRDTMVRNQAVLQQVRIIFFSPEASSVALVGDFNGWGQQEVTTASSSEMGVWEFVVALRPGVYHYNLLVDGKRWAANPKAATLVPDGFGGYDSVLVVTRKCRDDCT